MVLPNASFEPNFDSRGGRPIISTAALDEVHQLLKTLKEDSNPYPVARQAIELQLNAYENSLKDIPATLGLGEQFGVNFDKIQFKGTVGENPSDDAQKIHDALKDAGELAMVKKIWQWDRIPFPVRCVGLAMSSGEGENGDANATREPKKKRVEGDFFEDLDEWILHNEHYLRKCSKHPDAMKNGAWTEGLARIEDLPAVLSTCETFDTHLKITRPSIQGLPGFVTLSEKRRPTMFVQPSISKFTEHWNSSTGGLLNGLDWSNLFVAGGLVLGTLVTPLVSDPSAHKAVEWLTSDIDLYVYGLSPSQANEKIKHIAETYKKNLPKGSPFLLVRNSQTVTLYSSWPTRRVQIVLKLMKNPAEVLLNFDLDICAVGYDGEEVWMLPRFVRAIQTGLNVYTADLIEGHYLGDRKATREPRLFKYANKGYGLRILPSYVSVLSTYDSESRMSSIFRGDSVYKAPLSLDDLSKKAKEWTNKVLDLYLKLDYVKSGSKLPKEYWTNGVATTTKDGKPVFTHAMLENSYLQTSSEPLGRSCLTGFSLFMRHVALWEAESEGKISIHEDKWASETYGEALAQVSYDDVPAFQWDKNFNVPGFIKALDDFNIREQGHAAARPLSGVCRVAYSEEIDEIMSSKKDVIIPLILSKDFAEYGNRLIKEALGDVNRADALKVSDFDASDIGGSEEWEEVCVAWRLDSVLNWQMVDRRIDELREILWAFHRSNELLGIHNRTEQFQMCISQRAVRSAVHDEMASFVRWVARKPYSEPEHKLNLHFLLADMKGLDLHDMDDEDEEEDAEGDEDED